MLYLLAFIFPPIALLAKGKWVQAFLNLFLCLLFWIPGVVHACIVIAQCNAEERTDRIVEAMKKGKGL